jgi:VCBS repeat-containing protein
MIRISKIDKDIVYMTSKVGSHRYLTITYRGKYLYKSKRPQKVSKVIQKAESLLSTNMLHSFESAFNNVAASHDHDNYFNYRVALRADEFEA